MSEEEDLFNSDAESEDIFPGQYAIEDYLQNEDIFNLLTFNEKLNKKDLNVLKIYTDRYTEYKSKRVIESFQKLFALAPPIKKALQVFRGLTRECDKVKTNLDQLTSVSLSLNVSYKFALGPYFYEDGPQRTTPGCILRIHVPIGSKLLSPYVFSSGAIVEQELILPPGGFLQMVSKSDIEGIEIFDALYVPGTIRFEKISDLQIIKSREQQIEELITTCDIYFRYYEEGERPSLSDFETEVVMNLENCTQCLMRHQLLNDYIDNDQDIIVEALEKLLSRYVAEQTENISECQALDTKKALMILNTMVNHARSLSYH